ncbi:MAG: cytochrome c biogenesis protein ResB [Opitutales bacterium]|nr:cytochrome c biogenesis protein ResB [Opitutales bacterium]
MKELPLKIFYIFSSPILTAFLLSYAAAFIFIATLASSQMGIAQMQAQFIESWAAVFHFEAAGLDIFIPLIGGKTIGVLALANIAAAALRFTRRNIEGFGFAMVHAALALLIVSGFLQGKWRMEGAMEIQKGEPATAVYKMEGGKKFLLATLPFSVELKNFERQNYKNSDIAKGYSSLVEFRYAGKKIEKLISMNEPASFGAWTFYQSSYARGGETSILMAVKNPAGLLPTVSIALILIGMAFTYAVKIFKKSDEKVRNNS